MPTIRRGRRLAPPPWSLPTLALALWAGRAGAQTPATPEPTGAPPPEAKALVEVPKASSDVPTVDKPVDGTTVTASAGGQFVTGNSRLLAGTANGILDSRFGDNGFGASLLGNYGQGAPPGADIVATTENLQGRLRYDRYVAERASAFLIATGRFDRFQGLDFRLNLDPGVKYLFVKAQSEALWAELGYDFQYDIRRDDSRVELDANDQPIVGANGQHLLLDKTATDHSVRAFFGLRHAFNEEVNLSSGVEYLQSVVDSTRYRINFDALFAAKVGGGLAIGLGFTARYDHAPLPGKDMLDTTSTLSLIYSHTDAPAAPPSAPPSAAAPPPAPPPAPAPPPPPATPAPAPAPAAPPP